uniref:B-cell receptor CD22 n=1 Tax=Oncorhynchus tshawytscha TaxID=74940 RepID=A0A8C8CNY9_ONCTS
QNYSLLIIHLWSASPWTITVSPAEITAEKGLCAVISCTFTHPDNIKPTAAVWFKCPTKGKCDEDKIRIFHLKEPSKAHDGYEQRVSLLETDLTKKNCSVIINDIRENDAGEYQFRLPNSNTYPKKVKITVSGTMTIKSNQIKFYLSHTHALTQKPSVLTPPLTEGEPATLTCTAPGMCSGTPPNITWTWRGTGDNITEEDLTTVTTTHFSTLTFTPSAEHHNMMVTCQVTFQKKYQIEETVTLNVTYPQITGNEMVKEDGTLDLTCSVDSYPPSDITWSKNGTSTPLQNYTENATLTISNVTRQHAGDYVINLSLISLSSLSFPDLPVILPGSGCVDQAEVMTCLCVSQGVPSPLIVWPLLELNTERCSPTTSVLGSSVNSTISLPVGNHNNTTVECVSRNVVGVVREKLQVTQNKSQEKQRGKYVCQVTWLESHSFPFPPNVCNIEDVLYI